MSARAIRLLVAAAIVGVYGVRAVTGLLGGVAFAKASPLAVRGALEEAAPWLARAGVGINRYEAAWLTGEVRLGLWDALPAGRREGEGIVLLSRAAQSYLEAGALRPVASWHLAGLAETYRRVEDVSRNLRTVPLEALAAGPWSRVGRPGRVAAGLCRAIAERQPNAYVFQDACGSMLLDWGLVDDAMATWTRAVRAQPDLGQHAPFVRERIPEPLMRALIAVSREQLGRAPLLSRERHLFALGRFERSVGNLAQAESDLRAALAEPSDRIRRAEVWFHLGLVLEDQRRYDEAEPAMERALEAPVFRPGVHEARARFARARGDGEGELRWLGALRAESPGDLSLVLRFADAALRWGRPAEAEEAARWGCRLAPTDPAPRAALVEALLARRDFVGARQAWSDHRRLSGDTERSRELLARIEAAR